MMMGSSEGEGEKAGRPVLRTFVIWMESLLLVRLAALRLRGAVVVVGLGCAPIVAVVDCEDGNSGGRASFMRASLEP